MAGGYFSLKRLKSDQTLSEDFDEGGVDFVVLNGVRYFCTGDVGERRSPGEVKVIDRCKNHFKLAQGVFVAPEPLEALFVQSSLVDQIFVWGCSTMQSVAAVVVPSTQLASELGDSACVALLLTDFAQLGARNGLKAWEIPRKVLLEREAFSEKSGMFTASGKLSRAVLIQRYSAGLADDGFAVPEDRSMVAAASQELCAGLRQLLAQFGAHPAPSDPVTQLGLDSLGMARLAAAIARQFRVELPVNVLFSLETLGDLERVCLCGPNVLRHVMAKKTMIDFGREAYEAHQALVDECTRRAIQPSDSKASVLVTGATGFLGAFLAAELARSGRDILCLLRASSHDEAQRRFSDTLRFYRLEASNFPGSITLLPSRGIEMEGMGLAKEDFDLVLAQTSVIVHCAAEVSGVRPYEALYAANVMGTRRVLACAWQTKARLVHVSTMGFLPEGHAEVRKVLPDALILRSGYAQSKWVAEELVWKATEKPGVNAVVVRPGTVSGHPITGAANPQDALSILVLGLLQLGQVALEPGTPLPPGFNLVPIDHVADALVALASVDGSWFQPLHLCSPQAVSMATLCQWIRSAGYELEDIDVDTFCRSVLSLDDSHALFQFRSQLSVRHSEKQMPQMPRVTWGRASQLKLKSSHFVTKVGFQNSVAFLLSARPPTSPVLI